MRDYLYASVHLSQWAVVPAVVSHQIVGSTCNSAGNYVVVVRVARGWFHRLFRYLNPLGSCSQEGQSFYDSLFVKSQLYQLPRDFVVQKLRRQQRVFATSQRSRISNASPAGLGLLCADTKMFVSMTARIALFVVTPIFL